MPAVDPPLRRIKSKHELGDVLMDFTDKKTAPDVPDEIKQILMDMTLGGSDKLHLWEVEKCAEILERVKSACTPPTDGKPSYDQCDQGVDLLMKLMQAKNDNHPEMVYTHLPEQLQAVFKCWDLDGSGAVSAEELHAAAGAWTKMHEEKTLLKRLLFGSALIILVMFVGIFVLGMVTAELSKEFKANSGTMVDSTGRTVRVANSGFDVSKDGSLKVVEADGPGRLGADDETTLVSTQTARKEKSLHSALADSYFDALDEITVHSDKGHKLNLKIHGFARVPLLGARCGNVVYLFSAMDGHITLDSTDLSFNGPLAKLFENAGFEVAVGGAAGRRLESVQSVRGFFDKVAAVAAAGWKCEGVPLPKVPKMSTSSVVLYVPCSVDHVTRNRRSCDSSYGGQVVGVVAIPSQHLDAVSTRLDNVRRDIGGKVQARQVLYSTVTQTLMRSPSYELQFDYLPNHPTQERVIAVNTAKKEGVRFNRLTSSSARTLCEETDMSKDPAQQVADAKKDGVNASLHLEFVGVVGEGGTVYRRWRVMAADGFKRWMLGDVKTSKDYYEYWDDAQTFAPYRMLDSGGRLSTFLRAIEGTSDAEVEEVLGASSLDEAKTGAAHRFSCTTDEKDARHPSAGAVPGIHSPFEDLGVADLDFYVQELAEDIASRANASSQELAEDGSPAELVNETETDDDETKLVNAWAEMESVTEDDELFAFATYALRSRNFFAMPDACADVCSTSLADAKRAAGAKGMTEDVICGDGPFQTLVECLNGLMPPLLNSCQQNRFQMTMMEKCSVLGSLEQPAESAEAEDQVSVLPDGTHAIDAASLGAEAAETLGGADARLLVNTTADEVVVGAGGTSRSLSFSWCGSVFRPLCILIQVPFGCSSPADDVGDDAAAAEAKSKSRGRRGGVSESGRTGRRGGVSEVKQFKTAKKSKFKSPAKGGKKCKFWILVAIEIPGLGATKFPPSVCAPEVPAGPPKLKWWQLFQKKYQNAGKGWCTCEGVAYFGYKHESGKPGSGPEAQFIDLERWSHKSKAMTGKVWCSAKYMGGDPAPGYTKQCWCDGSSKPNPYWGLLVMLGGSFNVLGAAFPIPNPPVYGSVTAAGGISVSTRAACPKHGIKFSIAGWAEIGIKAGVDLALFELDVVAITIRIGAKLKLAAAYSSYHEVSRRRSPCGGCRRRWRGDWSRRRRQQWQSRWHPEICDVIVYAKVVFTVLVVRGWLLAEYGIRSKRFKLTLGVDYFNLFACWGGAWENVLSYMALDMTY